MTDARGKTLTLRAAPQRIVSLIPSNTEVLFALGAGDQIAAVTTADNYPPEVKQKPKIGGVMDASIEKIMAYNPDLVLAFGSLNQPLIGPLERLGVPMLVVDPKTLPETYDSIRLLGRAVGKDAEADRLVVTMRARIARVQQTVAKASHRPGVLMINQTNPIYTTGPDSFISDLIRIAGGRNVVEKPLTDNLLSEEDVILKQPEVIICARDLQASIQRVPGWRAGVPAGRNGRFFWEESEAYTVIRPTPRLATGIEELARFLHPELFPDKKGH